MPAFKPGISFDNASIGRVVVDANYRTKKRDMMREAIAGIASQYNETAITIGAQVFEEVLRKSRFRTNKRNVFRR
jgi:ElaA protein